MDGPKKKLKLTKETVRALNLKRVVGGDNDQASAGCNPTDYLACPPHPVSPASICCWTSFNICHEGGTF